MKTNSIICISREAAKQTIFAALNKLSNDELAEVIEDLLDEKDLSYDVEIRDGEDNSDELLKELL